jgi:pimeloyl-ACP methyl ester carboxylesterase
VTTFGLIHGGSHGAWCWERLVAELERLGHECVTVDLHMEDPDHGLDECAQLVADALAGIDRPVLLGHSISGAFLPLAAAKARASLMVFLCAMVPIEGKSLADQMSDDPSMVAFPYAMVSDELGRTLPTVDVARAMYYADCSEDEVEWAVARLVPQAPTIRLEPFPVDGWPRDVPAEYVVCTEDTVVSPDWSRRVARERLGAEPVEFPGAHSPFLTHPRELAQLLVNLAGRHPVTGRTIRP